MAESGSAEREVVSAGGDSKWVRWLSYLPFVAGGGLAALYVVGALTRTTQLIGAHVAVRDMLPLVPLQQLLAIGIGTVVSSLAYVPVMLLIVALLAVSDYLGTDAEPLELSAAERRSYEIIFGVVSAFVVLIVNPPATGAAVVIIAAGFVLVNVHYPGALARVSRSGGAILLVGAAVTVAVVNAYVYPQPLADVVLVRPDGLPDVRGKLVVDTGSGWYVRDGPNHVRAFSASDVLEARVRSHDRPRDDRTLRVVVKWIHGRL